MGATPPLMSLLPHEESMNTANTITLLFSDGYSSTVRVPQSETVLRAALQQGVPLLNECQEGACGTCKAACIHGTYTLDQYEEATLPHSEAKEGAVLSCRMHAQSDCVIELPYASSVAFRQGPKKYDARLHSLKRLSAAVMELAVELPAQERIAFLPGQYVNLLAPSVPSRSYSFANPPNESPIYRFCIRLFEGGAMSDYLTHRARIGDRIEVRGPFGTFFLREPTRPILMIAGGTGLAPMLSMLDHMQGTAKRKHPIHLLYGANASAEFFGISHLEELARWGMPLKWEVIPVAGSNDWKRETGHVTELIRRDLLLLQPDIYLCGPPPMIDAASRILHSHDVPSRQVYAERFLQGEAATTSSAGPAGPLSSETVSESVE